MMISLLSVHYLGDRKFSVSFSDGSAGTLDMGEYLAKRNGPLLEQLSDEFYLSRGFVEAVGSFGTAILTSFASPINIGTAFIPIGGQAYWGRIIAKAGALGGGMLKGAASNAA